MNPEGKMHDYSDLPEEEVPDMSQMVMVGNPEIAKTLANNMNECKGRGKRNPVAIQSAKKLKVSGESLNTLFDKAIRVGTRVRTSTGISKGSKILKSLGLDQMIQNRTDVVK